MPDWEALLDDANIFSMLERGTAKLAFLQVLASSYTVYCSSILIASELPAFTFRLSQK